MDQGEFRPFWWFGWFYVATMMRLLQLVAIAVTGTRPMLASSCGMRCGLVVGRARPIDRRHSVRGYAPEHQINECIGHLQCNLLSTPIKEYRLSFSTTPSASIDIDLIRLALWMTVHGHLVHGVFHWRIGERQSKRLFVCLVCHNFS